MNRLKEIREQQGLSQFKLAVLAGTYPSAIQMIETGKRGMTVAMAKKLAAALEVSLDYLCEEVA